MSPKAIFGLVRDTFKDWSEDKAARLGAALAYYTIFSIGPLLLIAVAIASFVFADAQAQIVSKIQGVVGGASAEVIAQTMNNANKSGANIFATVIGIVTLLLGASGVFGQLKDALNTIWEVQPKPGQGLLATLRERFLSFTMVLGTGFLLLVSLVVSAAVTALSDFLASILPGGDIIGFIISIVTSLLVVTLMFMLLFKFLPDVKIAWGDVWIGGLVTAILFLVGQFALGLYIGSGAVGTSFGAVSSLVIILVWIYYSTQILFLGAEFTQVYTNKYGSRVRPKENAELVTEDARAQQGMPAKDGKEADKDAKGAKGSGGRKRLKPSPWFQ
jgi:membrane protein